METAYTLKRSRRAKYMRLRVQPGGSVILTVPYASSQSSIERFLADHAGWLSRAIARMRPFKALPVSGRGAYLKHREEARALIEARLAYWNAIYRFPFARVSIKDTTSLWGSCSRRGNLNFNYKLLFLPAGLADYVIVHELCHLKEHNHGAGFWRLVAEAIPDYRARRRELRQYLLR